MCLSILAGGAQGAVLCEAEVLENLRDNPSFQRLIRHKADSVKLGKEGALHRNYQGLSEVASQRELLWLARYGVLSAQDKYLDRAMAAVQWGFEQQTPAGYFRNGLDLKPEKAMNADLFFMHAVVSFRQLLACYQLGEAYARTIEQWREPYSSALAWVEAHEKELYKHDRRTSNRMLFNVVALQLGSDWVSRPQTAKLAQKWLQEVLAKQTNEGVFPEKGGWDSSYQAVSCLNLMWLMMATQAEQLAPAISNGMRWLATRVSADGEISVEGNTRTGRGQERFFGQAKQVNYFEVALAFFYWGELSGERQYRVKAEAIINYMVQHG